MIIALKLVSPLWGALAVLMHIFTLVLLRPDHQVELLLDPKPKVEVILVRELVQFLKPVLEPFLSVRLQRLQPLVLLLLELPLEVSPKQLVVLLLELVQLARLFPGRYLAVSLDPGVALLLGLVPEAPLLLGVSLDLEFPRYASLELVVEPEL
jgi:hypothetical protein